MGIISQIKVDDVRDIGVPGQLADGGGHGTTDEDNVPNALGAVAGVHVFTVQTTTGDDDLALSEARTGESILVVSVTNAATSGPLVAAAINDNPVLRGLGEAVAVGAVVTYTLSNANIELAFTGNADLVVTEPTAEAEASRYPFGVPVYLDGGSATETYPDNSLDGDLYGFSIRALNQEAASPFSSDVSTAGRTDVRVLRSGRMYVAGGSDAVKGGILYVGTSTANATVAGQCYTTNATEREALSKSLGSWYGPNTIELKLGL